LQCLVGSQYNIATPQNIVNYFYVICGLAMYTPVNLIGSIFRKSVFLIVVTVRQGDFEHFNIFKSFHKKIYVFEL